MDNYVAAGVVAVYIAGIVVLILAVGYLLTYVPLLVLIGAAVVFNVLYAVAYQIVKRWISF